jgi:hypothetical protein
MIRTQLLLSNNVTSDDNLLIALHNNDYSMIRTQLLLSNNVTFNDNL